MMKTKHLLRVSMAAVLVACAPAFAANIVLNNVDLPGVGFNDPTPANPVPGNAGATVGDQRLIAYGKALELWGKTLRSKVRIVVQGSFDSLPCDANSGVLAQAGALQIFSDFPKAPLPGHWYGVALANAIAGADLTPGPPDPGLLAEPFNDDILAFFNGDVGKAGCLAGPGWYYGLDNNAPPGQIDFLDTFMHEVAHGLGFANFLDERVGATPAGLPDVYMANTGDLTLGKRWNELSAQEIVTSATNTGNVVWVGPRVTANAGGVLAAHEGVSLSGAVSGELEFGTASFGGVADINTFNGPVTLVNDGVGALSDGCEPITSSLVGQVALIDRGICTFAAKAVNAQNAGAKAVILANTLGRGTFDPGGADPAITIPVVGISNADGDRIKAALPNVNVAYFIDPTRRTGTTAGFVRLYAPSVVAPGSSISHWDTLAKPNLLLEPFINGDLRSAHNLDLTPSLMIDLGWKLETLKIDRCDTGVANALPTGELLHMAVEQCQASSQGRKAFVRCVADVARGAERQRLIRSSQRENIVECAEEAVERGR